MLNDKKINKNYGSLALAITAPALLAGCASTATPEKFSEQRDSFIENKNIEMPREKGVKVHGTPYVDSTPIAYRKGSENLVSVSSQGSSLSDTLQGPATALGYSISFTSAVDYKAPVNINLNNVGALDAIGKIAQAAGYVAVTDERNNTVTISDKATWVLRVPPSLFDGTESSFDVGSEAEESETSEDSSGSSGSPESSFSVKGSSNSDEREAFEENIKLMLSKTLDTDSSKATFSWNTGTISIEGDVFELNRVKTYIDEMVRHALTQIEVKTTIAEVRLTDSQQYGIDWNNLLSSATIKASIAGGPSIENPNFSATTTKNSVSAIIQAVAENNNISVLSSPSLLTKNNRPATIFNGKKIPYLPEINTESEDGVTSQGAEASYVSDGLSMSIIPSAIDNNTVSIKIIPSITDVGDFKTFDLSGSGGSGTTLEVPEVYQKQLYLDVTAGTGETVILGGTRTSSKDRGRSGVPGAVNSNNVVSKLFGGVDNADTEEELVIMVRANIIPAPQFNSLVSQSL